jgi:hypothetical protein
MTIAGDFSYQWQRNNNDIASANNSNYLLSADDIGSVLSVVVTYVDGQGSSDRLSSDATAPIADVPDLEPTDPEPPGEDPISSSPTGTPTILGLAMEDQRLTANTSAIADDDGIGSFLEGVVLSFIVNQIPGWITFFPGDGRITGTPQSADIGQSAVSLTLEDDEGLSDTLSFVLTIVDSQSVTLSWDAPTTRVNGDPLPLEELDHYEVSYYRTGESPTLVSVDIAQSSFTTNGLPPGTYHFQVKVIDNWALESEYTDELSAEIN